MTFAVYSDFWAYKYGVYTKTSGASMSGWHAVKVIGWGTQNGLDYWLCVNSWGKRWGSNGLFKIRRGTNEAYCETYGFDGILYECESDEFVNSYGRCENGETPATTVPETISTTTAEPVQPNCELKVCESFDFNRNDCDLPVAALEFSLVQQFSVTDCRKGENFWLSEGGTVLSVDHGCRGQFRYCEGTALPTVRFIVTVFIQNLK